jgi:hypothetical protein
MRQLGDGVDVEDVDEEEFVRGVDPRTFASVAACEDGPAA